MSDRLNVSFLQTNSGFEFLDQDILGMAASDGDGDTLSKDEAYGYTRTRTALADTADYEGGDYAGAWLYGTLEKYLAARAYMIAANSVVEESKVIDLLMFGADKAIVDSDVTKIESSLSNELVVQSMIKYLASTGNFDLAKAALEHPDADVVEAAQSALARMSTPGSANAEKIKKDLEKPANELARASMIKVLGKTADNSAMETLLALANDPKASSSEREAAAWTMFDIFNTSPKETLKFVIDTEKNGKPLAGAVQFILGNTLKRANSDVEWKDSVWNDFTDKIMDNLEEALKAADVDVGAKVIVASVLGSIPKARAYKMLTEMLSKEMDDKVVIASAASLLRQYHNIEDLEIDGTAEKLDIVGVEKEIVQLLHEKARLKRWTYGDASNDKKVWEYYGLENVDNDDFDPAGGVDQLAGKYSPVDRLILAFVISGFGGRTSVEALKDLFGSDYEEFFHKEIAREIGKKGDEADAKPVFEKTLQAGNSTSADKGFARAIGEFGVQSAMPVLDRLLAEKPDIREDVIKAYRKIGPAASDKLVAILESPDTNYVEKAAAIYNLASSGTRAALPSLSKIAAFYESPVDTRSNPTFRNIAPFVPVEAVSLDDFRESLHLKEFEVALVVNELVSRLGKTDTKEGKATEKFLRGALANEETGDAVIALIKEFMAAQSGDWDRTADYVQSQKERYQEIQAYLAKTPWDAKGFQRFLDGRGYNRAEVMGQFTLLKPDDIEKEMSALSPMDVVNLSKDGWQDMELWKYLMTHQWDKKEVIEALSNLVWFYDRDQRATANEVAINDKSSECDEIREDADKCGKIAAFALNPKNEPISSELKDQILSEAGAWQCVAPEAGECVDKDGNFVEGLYGAFTCLTVGAQECARIECEGTNEATKGADAEMCTNELFALMDETAHKEDVATGSEPSDVEIRLEQYPEIAEFVDDVEAAKDEATNRDSMKQFAAGRIEDLDYLASAVNDRRWEKFEIEDHLTTESDWTDAEIANLRKAEPLNTGNSFGRKLAEIYGTTSENYEDQRIAETDAFEEFADTLKKSEWTEAECLKVHTVLEYLNGLYGLEGANFMLEKIVARKADGDDAEALGEFYDSAKEALSFKASEDGLFFKRLQQALDENVRFPDREAVWTSLFNIIRSEEGAEELREAFKSVAENEDDSGIRDEVVKTLKTDADSDAQFDSDDVASAMVQHVKDGTVDRLSATQNIVAGLQKSEIGDSKKFLASLAVPAIESINLSYRILDILKQRLAGTDYRYDGTATDISDLVDEDAAVRFGATLQDPETSHEDRMVSAVALGFINSEESLKYLRRAIEYGTDNEVVFAAAAAMSNLPGNDSFAQLWRHHGSESEITRLAGAMGLARRSIFSDNLTATQQLKADEAYVWLQNEMTQNMWATAAAGYIVTDQNFDLLRSLATGKDRPNGVKEMAQIALDPVRRGLLEKEIAAYPAYRVPIVIIKSKYTSTKDSADAADVVKSLYVNATDGQKGYFLNEILAIMDDKRPETEAARAKLADFFAKNSSNYALGSKELKIVAKAVNDASPLVSQIAINEAFGSRGASVAIQEKLIDAIKFTSANSTAALDTIVKNPGVAENIKEYAVESYGNTHDLLKVASDSNNSLGLRIHALKCLNGCPCKSPTIEADLKVLIHDLEAANCTDCQRIKETAETALASIGAKTICS